jgi:Acetyltransferase (GNAT) domain
MAGVEIRDYRGNFEDVAELARRVWVPQYGGRTWVPLPDAAYLRWRVTQSGALCPVAYDGTKLVGSVFSVPQSMRVGGSVFPVAFFTGFTADPEYRGVALPLIERLRRDNEERGIAFGIGMVLDEPRSASYRFWTKYAEAFPQNFRLLFSGGYWAKFLGPHALARAGIQAWERLASRALGPLMRFTPYGIDPHVRPYRAADLERCAQMLDKTTAGFDWAVVWQPTELSSQLENSAYRTLVFERDGRVRGMINYHCFSLHGRELIRAVAIDLWAADDLSGSEQLRFVSHLCTDLIEQDVHGVVAPRSAMMPAAAFVANLFIPAPQRFRIGIFLTPRTIPLAPPKTWSFEIT